MFDRRFNCRGGAVVQKRPAEPQSPERRGTNLLAVSSRLLDAVAGSDVMQQQIGKQWYRFAIEGRVRARTRFEPRDVASGATGIGEDRFASKGRFVRLTSSGWSQKT